jgi:hypothetical protein
MIVEDWFPSAVEGKKLINDSAMLTTRTSNIRIRSRFPVDKRFIRFFFSRICSRKRDVAAWRSLVCRILKYSP